MQELRFIGPFSFSDPVPTIDSIDPGTNGVYLWCVKGTTPSDSIYRVHYIGEAMDIASRLRHHRNEQLLGRYTAFCPDGLRQNIKILMHRARKGMVSRFSTMDRDEFNRQFLGAISVFYADLGKQADKNLRCRYEHALHSTVEDYGQNILHVGHLRSSQDERFAVIIDTSGVNIEALSGTVLHV